MEVIQCAWFTRVTIMDQVAQIREKIDLIALISEHAPLKKAGRNFKALCPFHTEKSPSFVVSPERQIWHCFGCGKGGDCFTFLMEYEKLEFVEALRILARRVGVVLSEVSYAGQSLSQKEKLYRLNRMALDFYHYLLTKHPVGKKALSYLQESRGLKQQVVDTFALGFAPSLGTALVAYLTQKKKSSKEDIIAAGLGFYKNGRLTDFFANRIIFPIIDHRDNVVGFAGRVLDDSAKISKYINTRETLVYHKGSILFGLNIAKEHIKKENTILIVEGEFDVISLFQEGVGIAVAVKGTALTDNHASLIARFTKKVVLSFDKDAAGKDAVKRSLSALEKKEFDVYILEMPSGKDPDDAIRADPIAFKKALKHDISVYDYLHQTALASFNAKTAEGKRHIVEELLSVYARISNEVVKEHYLRKLSLSLETSYESIQKQLDKLSVDSKITYKTEATEEKKNRREMLERYLLALLLQGKGQKEIIEDIRSIVFDISWFVPAYRKICEALREYIVIKDFTIDGFVAYLPVELLGAFDTCYLFPLPSFLSDELYREEIKKVADEIRSLSLRVTMREISDQIKKREKILIEQQLSEDDQELEILREKFVNITNNMQNNSKTSKV